ncbi:type II toxin-antitoxin system HicB family antitoxin [Natrialbaceae archaeon A-arb3/5]
MSTETDRNGPSEARTTITLTLEEEWWVATDEETGVTSQGKSRVEALENLDEAVEGYNGAGTEPSADELRELGIDPANNASDSSLPDELQ